MPMVCLLAVMVQWQKRLRVRLDSGLVQSATTAIRCSTPATLLYHRWSGEAAIRCSRATNAPLSDLQPPQSVNISQPHNQELLGMPIVPTHT